MGKAFVYPDNVDTDVIIPARYLNNTDGALLAAHCMEDIDASFSKTVLPGDIIVAGENFGCGSSREHAPIAIKACGVKCVIAKSFARIFYRNAINVGLPILECPTIEAESFDIIEVDLSCGVIENLTSKKKYTTTAFPEFIQKIISDGGRLNSVKNAVKR